MKIVEEISLRNFEFWSGAVDNASQLTDDELDELETIFEEMGEEWTDTKINDAMWFDFDTICDWLNLEQDDNGDVLREE